MQIKEVINSLNLQLLTHTGERLRAAMLLTF